MQEQAQAYLVHRVRFGKRERLANKPPDPLAQRIVPPLDMVGLPALFADRVMLLIRNDLLISVPEVRINRSPLVGRRDARPQQMARGLAAVADSRGDNLAGSSAEREPNPALVLLEADERPEFIEFQRLVEFCFHERLLQGRQELDFF